MSGGRAVWVKVRASEAERAEWHAKACSAGLTLSDLVRRAVGRAAHLDRGAVDAVEVIAHLIAIKQALAAVSHLESTDADAGWVELPEGPDQRAARPNTSLGELLTRYGHTSAHSSGWWRYSTTHRVSPS